MKEQIINKAQELYPITDNAECFTAFLQGANIAKKEVIEYVVKWLDENYFNVYEGTWNQVREQFIEDFKKAMSTEVLA